MLLSYLSTAIAARVFTDAQTETPCKYGVALHMNQPKCHSETKGRISFFQKSVYSDIHFCCEEKHKAFGYALLHLRSFTAMYILL